LKIPFNVITPCVDETPNFNESPENMVLRLALEKAQNVSLRSPNSLVISSDQVAMLGDQKIGKPGSHEKALKQLKMMRNQHIIFHTSLCLLDNRGIQCKSDIRMETIKTSVTFRDLTDAELEAYLKTEKPYDCAGSIKSEGLGIAILEKIESTDPTALTGLPLIALTSMLRCADVPFFMN
jgi:septum formation protein